MNLSAVVHISRNLPCVGSKPISLANLGFTSSTPSEMAVRT
jgi:hypothetical protein